jgi:hypothetical protein
MRVRFMNEGSLGDRVAAHAHGLATTSSGDDDVTLEVENAANGNLIHVFLLGEECADAQRLGRTSHWYLV